MSDDESTARPEPKLTERQMQVAMLLAVGKKNAEIAAELGIDCKTVDTHRMHVLKRLKLRNNVELARHALREGWVTL